MGITHVFAHTYLSITLIISHYLSLNIPAKNLCSNFALEIKGKSLPLPLPRRGDSENRDVILSENEGSRAGTWPITLRDCLNGDLKVVSLRSE